MRTRVMVRDPETGTLRTDWSENVPGGYARLPGHRGELVVGLPGAEERQRTMTREAMRKHRAA